MTEEKAPGLKIQGLGVKRDRINLKATSPGAKGRGCPDGLICLTMKIDQAIKLIHSITGNSEVKISDFKSFHDACDWVLSEFAAWNANSVMTSERDNPDLIEGK